jgi:tRNA threonylcarbamoyladenosine biosynthesis protein TsaB
VRVLALDGALGGFSVALDDGTAVRAYASERQDALEHGLERVDEVLRSGGLRLRDLDLLAVGLGPGSFTGSRIAVAYAKSLAYGARLPLVGVSSYDALEPDAAPRPLLAVVRGRRGVVCARLRTANAEPALACGAVALVLDRLLTGTPGSVHVVGNTEDVLSQIAERGWNVRALPPRTAVPAAAIAELARRRDPSVGPHALAPDYGEAPAVSVPRSPIPPAAT